MAKQRTEESTKASGETGSHEIPDSVIDQLLMGYRKPEDLTGKGGILKQLVSRLVSRAMEAELEHHLGYANGEKPPEGQDNRRNGKTKKTLRTDHGPLDVEVPRDRAGSFSPQIVGKHERHFSGFDDKILSMYARGMSVRDIQSHLEEIYGVEVGPDLISKVTDAVLEEQRAWQSRALEPVYLVVYIDAIFAKIRDKGVVQNRAVYTVMGIAPDGKKDILGFWAQGAEGAKFWLSIFGELRQRGLQDILILCADGLTGIKDAIEAAWPRAIHQTCIVHMIRSSMRLVPWKERKAVCAALRPVYTAPDEQAAELALTELRAHVGKEFPHGGSGMASTLGRNCPIFGVPRRNSQGYLHDERARILQRPATQGLEQQGPHAERRCRPQAVVSGVAACHKSLAASLRLETGARPVCDLFRRTFQHLNRTSEPVHKKPYSLALSHDARANRRPGSARAELGYGEVVTRPAAGVTTGGPDEPYVNSTSTVP